MTTDKLKIPKGFRIVRNGASIRVGDRFKKQNGHWSKTSDYGRKVKRGGEPQHYTQPQYSGIYIRRITTKSK